jgi:hypothetical protein
MLNTAGGDNTPRFGEEYYRVPPCRGFAHKFFLSSQQRQKTTSYKQKLKEKQDYKPQPIKRTKMGVTLSISKHEETKNKVPQC